MKILTFALFIVLLIGCQTDKEIKTISDSNGNQYNYTNQELVHLLKNREFYSTNQADLLGMLGDPWDETKLRRALSSPVRYGDTDNLYSSLDYLLISIDTLSKTTKYKDKSKFGLLMLPYTVDDSVSLVMSKNFKSINDSLFIDAFKDYKKDNKKPTLTEEQYFLLAFKDKMGVAFRIVHEGEIIPDHFDNPETGEVEDIRTIFNYSNICPPNCNLISNSQSK